MLSKLQVDQSLIANQADQRIEMRTAMPCGLTGFTTEQNTVRKQFHRKQAKKENRSAISFDNKAGWLAMAHR